MTTPTSIDVSVLDDRLVMVLADGRELAAPLAWFPRLLEANPRAASHWRFIGRGHGIHWSDIECRHFGCRFAPRRLTTFSGALPGKIAWQARYAGSRPQWTLPRTRRTLRAIPHSPGGIRCPGRERASRRLALRCRRCGRAVSLPR